MNMNFILPTRIVCGKDCVKKNGSLLRALGEKPLIVTGKTSARACGALRDTVEALEGEYALFDGIRQNPTVQSCFDGAKLALGSGCDYIIGIGGGSPLDAAKAIAVIAANPELDEEGLFSNDWTCKPLPIVCIGTTAGTGSEVTPVAVLTDGENRKKSIRHQVIFPTLSFGDYRYTLELPEAFVKSTAVDALSHCVESYFNKTSEGMSAHFATLGIASMAEALVALSEKGVAALTEQHREQLYFASICGGLAISVTGTALCHAMGYFLTEDHGISHGNACGVYLKEFLLRSEKAEPELAKSFYEKVCLKREALFACLDSLLQGVETKLSEKELASLEKRWKNNKSISKSLFSLTEKQATALLRSLFC